MPGLSHERHTTRIHNLSLAVSGERQLLTHTHGRCFSIVPQITSPCALEALGRLPVYSPLPKSRGPLQEALASASSFFDVPFEVLSVQDWCCSRQTADRNHASPGRSSHVASVCGEFHTKPACSQVGVVIWGRVFYAARCCTGPGLMAVCRRCTVPFTYGLR